MSNARFQLRRLMIAPVAVSCKPMLDRNPDLRPDVDLPRPSRLHSFSALLKRRAVNSLVHEEERNVRRCKSHDALCG